MAVDNEKDWPLRGASCFNEPLLPNFNQALNPDVSAEHARPTLMHWIMLSARFWWRWLTETAS